MDDYLIRLARPEEAVLMPDLEIEAARRFAQIGRPEIADLPAQPVAFYRDCAAAGSLWVPAMAQSPDGPPLGLAAAARRDGMAWLAELDVVPAHGQRGLGRRLVEAVIAWAAGEGLPAVVLTTFRDIPFNAPFYSRIGFRPFVPGPGHPFLAEVRRTEQASGLDRMSPRVAMRLDLTPKRFRSSPP
ncbi:GNAT family N-acetyltransferase [Marinibaculum pumilum]|uniref:GNAT family N-acetyltransferase n=1 Tax=Marinibaculum pumilum TaxID=1766165 RepID=A0ABV7KWD1_9PROT